VFTNVQLLPTPLEFHAHLCPCTLHTAYHISIILDVLTYVILDVLTYVVLDLLTNVQLL